MKTHEDLILGNSLSTILAEQEKMMPRISEYQFQREVLDILENPFTQEALQRYSLYVGELTKPLHVVQNDDQAITLFIVPALVQTPVTTIPRGNGITPESFLRSLGRDADLGGRNINEKIRLFMTQITRVPNYIQNVILPIQDILAKHGRRMIDLPGLDNPTGSPAEEQSTVAGNSSFGDEYDD